MPTRSPMPQSLRREPPRSHLEGGSSEQLSLLSRAPSSVGEQQEIVYQAIREMVDAAGGVVWLAASMERAVGNVSTRLHRGLDGKGDVLTAPADFIAHAATDPQTRIVFLSALCAAWGFKAPEYAAKVVTDDEILRAFERDAEKCGEAGEAQISRIARDLGCDVAAVRRAGR